MENRTETQFVNPERKIPKKLELYFSFGSHVQKDVASLPRIIQDALSFFEPQARNLFFFEMFGMTPTQARKTEAYHRQGIPYLDAHFLAGGLSTNEISRAKEKIEKATDPDGQTVRFGLKQLEFLDRAIAEGNEIQIIFETHPPQSLSVIKTQYDQVFRENESKAILLWSQGQSEEALDAFQRSQRGLVTSTMMRDDDIADQIKDLQKRAKRDIRKTRLFVRLGLGHYLLAERFDYLKPQVSFDPLTDNQKETLEYFHRLYREGQKSLSQEEWEDYFRAARGFLADLIS